MDWLLLVMTLAGQQGAVRIRVWRALKAIGAAVLRDGVYLAPARDELFDALREQQREITQSGGSAFVFRISATKAEDDAILRALFDRREEYGALLSAVNEFVTAVVTQQRTELEARRTLRQLKRDYDGVVATDFFPGSARIEAQTALEHAEHVLTRVLSPEEPTPVQTPIPRRELSDFQQRVWATRERLWVDRVASAWLIKRFIDSGATFLWLEHANDCPPEAIGFDFDGAMFTHVDELITFEVLLKSFGLDANDALVRLGVMVRSLDVGGLRVPEAAGFEALLTGAREVYPTDDAFLAEISNTLDCLYIAFTQGAAESTRTTVSTSIPET